jgi:hypothetical protein
MLWHTTTPIREDESEGRFSIRWRACGFGIWAAQAYCGDTLLEEWTSLDQADVRERARAACQRMAWGWVA